MLVSSHEGTEVESTRQSKMLLLFGLLQWLIEKQRLSAEQQGTVQVAGCQDSLQNVELH